MNLDQTINKAIRDRHEILLSRQGEPQMHSVYEDLQKAKQAQEGEVRMHGGKKVKKVGNKWVPVVERKMPPKQEEKKKTSSKKKEEKSNKKKMPSHMSRHHIGTLRHVKELVGGGKFHEAHMLAEKLPDEVKHEIPANVWKDMVKHSHEASIKEQAENKKAKADSLKAAIGVKKEQPKKEK